jgi:tRNA-2-methylthio-N6-dimethylallyladenosine synthase
MAKLHKYHILTFGCQMNKSDSERLEAILRKMGMILAESKEDADFPHDFPDGH